MPQISISDLEREVERLAGLAGVRVAVVALTQPADGHVRAGAAVLGRMTSAEMEVSAHALLGHMARRIADDPACGRCPSCRGAADRLQRAADDLGVQGFAGSVH